MAILSYSSKTSNLEKPKNGQMALTIKFGPNPGDVVFYPDSGGGDSMPLAIEIAKIVILLYENPKLILCAARACGGSGSDGGGGSERSRGDGGGGSEHI